MVSISSQFIKRAEDAVYHHPYLIPKLFTECNVKKGFVHSRLRRYVPHRIGIEFECFGDFSNNFISQNNLKWNNFECFIKYFKLRDFSQEISIKRFRRSYLSKSDSKNEIRVSIQDYRQLDGLYRILKEMAKYCTISSDCGIHIHVDLTKYGLSSQKDMAVDWFNRNLHEVESIFPKYEGSYNKKIAKRGKASWVNLSSHDTVEFRIAPLTFDYEVIIPWIVKCSKLVSQMLSECHLDRMAKRKAKYEPYSDIIDISNLYLQDDLPSGDTLSALEGSDFETMEESNAIRRVAYELMVRELDRELVDHYITGNILRLDYPDGTQAEIPIAQAEQAYLDGGMPEVLARAHAIIQSTNNDIRWASGSSYNDTTYFTASGREWGAWDGRVI